MGKGRRNRKLRTDVVMHVKRGQRIQDTESFIFDEGDSAPTLADLESIMGSLGRGEFTPLNPITKLSLKDQEVIQEFEDMVNFAFDEFGQENVHVTGDANYPKTLRMFILDNEEN
jgi:hypothetical protein